MEFSENYLDTMLGSAIEFFNRDSKQAEYEIPQSLENPNQAINIFTDCLKNEAHRSFQQTTVSKEPILYTVNLDSENPGIVVEVDKSKSKIKIYNKTNYNLKKVHKKRKNYKNIETIEKDAKNELEKLLTKQTEINQREDFKSNQKIINQTNTQLKKLNTQLSKLNQQRDELEQQISEIDPQEINSRPNQNILKRKNKLLDKSKILSDDIQQKNEEINPYKEKVNQYTELQQMKKIQREVIKQQKIEQKQKKLEEKENKKMSEQKLKEPELDQSESLNLDDQNKSSKTTTLESNHFDNELSSENKESDSQNNCNNKANSNHLEQLDESLQKKNIKSKKKKINQIPKEEINDELFDILESYKNYNSEQILESNIIDLNQVKLYPSPIPFNRHLKALEDCNPNPILLPILLYGKTDSYSEGIKIIHGPPGTGKTSRLITELTHLLNKNPKEKILLCAPSNIGVINLYQRALSFGIHGCLILSNNKIPCNFDLANQKSKDNIVFTTISMRFGKILDNIKFTKIIMDEASQCQEAWCWGLLRREVNQLIMAGDPYQLPSLVSETGEKLKYNRSLMERLMEIKVPSELLDVQRRMHPLIAEFSNQHYYSNKLKTNYQSNFNLQPLLILNINGNEEKINNSYQNRIEVERLNQEYKILKNIFQEVIVISPYQAQCNLIKEINPAIIVHTIDSFQGKEAEAVIITTVRSGTTVGFWNDYRRLNVAMTRAKHALRIIGDINTWKHENSPLKDLYLFSKSKNLII
jgi:uncharacterized protein YoxC